jgi:hypothetical protein
MLAKGRDRVLVRLTLACAVVLTVVWTNMPASIQEQRKETNSILKEYVVVVQGVQLVFKNLPIVVTAKAPWVISLSFVPITFQPEIVVTVEGESRSSGTIEVVDGGYLYHMIVGEPGEHRLVATIEFLDVTGISQINQTMREREHLRSFQHHNSTVVLKHNFSVLPGKPSLMMPPFDCKPQTLLEGSWLISSKFSILMQPANHSGLPWLWKPHSCSNPVFQSPQDFRNGLKKFKRIMFVGDSLMRNVFNAIADLAVNYELPFHGMKSHWCRTNQSHYYKSGSWELELLGKHKSWFGKSWCGEQGGANLNMTLENKNVQLTYLTSGFSADTPRDPILSVLANYTFDCLVVNYGLHDVSKYSLDEFEHHISQRMSKLSDIQRTRGVRVFFLGMWAQRPLRKPIAWKWTGSHTRVLDFIRITKKAATMYNVEYIDMYGMTLSLLEFNQDGIHFLPEVNRPIAMILSEFIGAGLPTK